MLDFTSILNRVDSKSVVKCFGESKEKNIMRFKQKKDIN